MSKSRIVEIVEENGINYGQISSPLDLNKAQAFAHEHIEQITNDFLTSASVETAGCEIALAAFLSFDIGGGRIYRAGSQYDAEGVTLTMDEADSQFTRIDSVVAVLAANVPANNEFLAFQRLRSVQELNANAPAYPPTQFQRATERHHVAAVTIRKGEPAAAPLSPPLAPNEVELYRIIVPANAVAIQNANVSNLRNPVVNLVSVKSELASLTAQIALVEKKLLVLKYRYPTILTGNGKLPFNIAQDGGAWVVDIPIGIDVQFGDGFVRIKAENFQDADADAQYVNISNSAVTYLPLVEPDGAPTHNALSGNEIRFRVPAGVKALYLNRDGELFFRDAIAPSNPTECILLKIDNSAGGGAAPEAQSYRNLRNGITIYSKTQVAGSPESKQFILDMGVPVGVLYPDCYAVRAADNLRYSIPTPVINFDSTVTVSGVADGDQWFVELSVLSAL